MNTAVTAELFLALAAAWMFMQLESLRWGVRHVGVFLCLGYWIGISFTFPLFVATWLHARAVAWKRHDAAASNPAPVEFAYWSTAACVARARV